VVVCVAGFRPATRPSLTQPSLARSGPAHPLRPSLPLCARPLSLPFSHSIFPRSNPLSSTSLSLPPRALGDSMTVIVGFWIPEVSSPSLSPSLSLSLSLPSSIHAHAPFFPARVPRWLPACALGGGPAPPPRNPAPLCAHARRWPRGPTPPDGRALPGRPRAPLRGPAPPRRLCASLAALARRARARDHSVRDA
jgi:hypothetical protein